MADVKTYDPSQVATIVSGVSMSGYGPDTFIAVAREVPSWSKKVGGKGEVGRSKSSNKSGSITLTIMQTSSDNDFLSGLALLDEQTGSGTFPIIIKDASGSTVVSALNCWISKYPDPEFAQEVGVREWVFDCDSINMLIGGN